MAKYNNVSTKPVKRFFVEMLTRDISTEDAILDLLDNCLDGILRSIDTPPSGDTPYEGFWASVKVNGDLFVIEDNCGGIPWSEHERTFRMGRLPNVEYPDQQIKKTVGVYGIGMKRAIFKMGREAIIKTQNDGDNYEVPFSSEWMKDEEVWDLEVTESSEKMESDGTVISISELHPDVSEQFSSDGFADALLDKIQNHYSVIIQKGFKVTVNGIEATHKPIQFRFAEEDEAGKPIIRPYMFRSSDENMEVFLAVGLREPIPDVEKILQDHEGQQYSSDYAGWTVICNDRVVLYCNKDELTGWGTAGVPRYHNQFIAISGVVEFTGDPEFLPTTTTKRGLNYSSTTYQQVLDRMREGTGLFVDFTNKWKTREEEAKRIVSPSSSISYKELKTKVEQLKFNQTHRGLKGEQFKPELPKPEVIERDARISYYRGKDQIRRLAEELIEDYEEIPDRDLRRSVGEESFDFAYKKLIGRQDE